MTDDQRPPAGVDADKDDGSETSAGVPNEDAARHPEATVEAPDPARDLPSPTVEVPDPAAAGPDEADESEATVDVPRELWVSFWYLVVVFDAAVLAAGVGLLLLTLGNDPGLGGRLLSVGAVLGLYGYYRYRRNPHCAGADADGDAAG
ncbi:hypothetical protein BRD13_04080 [Halobacteriales archaeon SW_5_70_135]|nr:MAG: hypothetical protein BRD13_04080 [Halobacteriales archaeon SW_5_70_135]